MNIVDFYVSMIGQADSLFIAGLVLAALGEKSPRGNFPLYRGIVREGLEALYLDLLNRSN